MRYLTDRQEIAAAINFGKYPVIRIDMDHKYMEGSDYCTGDKVRVSWDRPDYPNMTTRGEVYWSPERSKFCISGFGACLSSDFGRHDVLEMYEWANSALVHKGQVVILIVDSSESKRCYVRAMKVSERIDIHCQTVATLEDMPEDYQIEGYEEIKRGVRRRG